MKTQTPTAPRCEESDALGGLPAGSLLPLWRRINREFLVHSQKWGLPPNVCMALLHLLLHPRDSEPAAMAAAIYFPRQTVTFILDFLERRRLAVRRPHPKDRRRKTVQLTARGRATAEGMFRDLLAFEAGALRTIEDVDADRLKTFLARYADALAAQNDRDLKT